MYRALRTVLLSSVFPFLAIGVSVAQVDDRTKLASVADNSASETVIVTGTREQGKSALQSVSPVDVVGVASLAQTGQSNLSDSLSQLLPSITKPNFGHSQGSPTDFISLRGLNPNQTLTLINGKRRHNSSVLYQGGTFDGSTPVDLDMLPSGLVDHVEILRDGAGAQYGSDAIAGVVNVILKSSDQGGNYQAQAGRYYAGDGFTATVDGEQGFALGNDGFIDISGGYRVHDHTDRDALDNRTNQPDVHLFGDPASVRVDIGVNAGYNLSDTVQLYSFDTYAHRIAAINELYRLPSSLPAVYPNGYAPLYHTAEDDFSWTVGAKGQDLLGWNWDVSSTFGSDFIAYGNRNTANLGQYAAIGSTRTAYHVWSTTGRQIVSNVDLSRSVGLFGIPVNVAIGAEHTLDSYVVTPGDPDSYVYGGLQAVTGLAPVNASHSTRDVYSTYFDLESSITEAWQVGVSGRYEDFSDFGETYAGKVSTRYDVAPWLAIRGTLSNGSRAPSLANEHYSSIGVTPTSISGRLPANSEAAALLGAKQLKPENATNMTVGLVLQPLDGLHMTVDAYQISIYDRIVTGAAHSGAVAVQALALAGLNVSPTILPQNVSASYFTNAGNSKTQGIDFQADYLTDFDNYGTVNWDIGLNYNHSIITHVNLDSNGAPLINAQTRAYMTTESPKFRTTFGGRWTLDRWDLTLHEQYYGDTQAQLTYLAGPTANSTSQWIPFVNDAKWVTNLEVGYLLNDNLSLALGANNLFNALPNEIPTLARYYNTEKYDGDASQVGIDGGYYYARISYKF